MVRTWRVTATSLVLLSTGLMTACLFSSDEEDPDNSGGSSGKGGTGGVGGATGGVGGATGGVGGATGGTGGSVAGTGGATAGTGGAAAGAAGSSAGTAGAAGAGGPFACQGTAPTCSTIAQFAEWGMGDFHGGASVFGSGLTQDMSDLGVLHVTGMVGGYGHGFNIWFTFCSNLSTATGGITFTVRGTTGDATPNLIDFQPQTNSTYPWEPFPLVNAKGGCTAMPAGADPWSYCIAPAARVTLSDLPQTVPWAMVTGGAPVPFDAATSPAEIVGLQWQFPWTSTSTAYAVDVYLDDVKLAGVTPETDCGTYTATGGMGGMGGMAGSAGSGAGMAGDAGMAGTAGSAGNGGMGGMAGMSGAAGSGAGTAGSAGSAGSAGAAGAAGMSGAAGSGAGTAGNGGAAGTN